MTVRTEVARDYPLRGPGAPRDLRLLPVAGGAWGVALFCVFMPDTSAWWAGGCAAAALITALVTMFRRPPAAAPGGLLIVVLAVGAAVAFTVTSETANREAVRAWDGRVVEAVGEVISSASLGKDGRLWIDVQLTALGPPGTARDVSAPARVGVEPGEGFDLGASLRVSGEARAADAGERAALVVFATEAEVERPAGGVFAMAAGLRQAFIERASRLPDPGAGLLPGLAVGDTRAVSTELNEDMRTSGLSHLTAVSGANCAIVVGAVFWIAALCGASRAVRIIAAAIALAGFVVLVTPEPSVVRAAVMAGTAMISILIGRPSAGAGMLSVSAVGILLVDPWLASTAGFALSVAASGALILLAPPLHRGLCRWLPPPLALAIAVPAAAQLACGPIIALFSEQQSLVGLAANLLAAPAAPIATVIGLLACLCAPIPPIADLLAASAWLPAAWIAGTADVTAALPFAQIDALPGIGSALIVAVVSAALAVLLTDSTRMHGARLCGALLYGAVRSVAGVVVAATIALGAAQLLLHGPLAAASSPRGWAIAACDVGQGDALVIRSEGEVALIDTGPEPEPLADCLASLGVDRIDVLVLTHFDLDHVGGASAVRGRVDVVMHGPPDGPDDERLLLDMAAGGAEVTPVAAGYQGTLGGADWRVLWPQKRATVFPSGNDASVVLEISGGGVPRSIFLGDLSAEAQRLMARSSHVRGGYAVVKVAHHGSGDQDADLYATLDPDVAVIPVGEDNDYGHPRQDTLSILRALDAHVLRTDTQGRILLGVDDGAIDVWTDTG